MTGIDKEFVYPAVATVVALAGAGFDIKSRRIPNFITGPAILAGLVLHASLDGWRGLLTSLAAALICGIIFLIFYIAGGMGAGDVKLITAVGCIAGLSNAAYLLVLTSLAGGVMGVVFALMRGRLKETLLNVGTIASHHKDEGLKPHPDLNVRNVSTLRLPYGVAIAAGSTITFYLLGMPR
jgi:prepilin peptidase CpaA